VKIPNRIVLPDPQLIVNIWEPDMQALNDCRRINGSRTAHRIVRQKPVSMCDVVVQRNHHVLVNSRQQIAAPAWRDLRVGCCTRT
jgi:hypothetical protein